MCVSLSSCQSWLHRNRSSGGLFDPTQAAAINKFPSSDFQKGIVGQPLDGPLKVMVTDAEGNPVSGVSVTFSTIGDSGGIPLSATATTNIQGIAQTLYQLGTETKMDPLLALNDPEDEFPYQVGRHLITASVTGKDSIHITDPFYAFAFPDEAADLEEIVSAHCIYPFLGGSAINYRVIDQYGNPVSNVPVEFHTDGYEWLGEPEDAPTSLQESLIVFVTIEEYNNCGGIIRSGECGDQTDSITRNSQADGKVWVYPIAGDVAPAEYKFTVSAGFCDPKHPSRTTCDIASISTTGNYSLVGLFTAQTVSDGGTLIEAYRTETEVPRPLELQLFFYKEGYTVKHDPDSDWYYIRGTGVFSFDPVTQSDVDFSVTGTGSANPAAVGAAPFQTTVTLGSEPAVYFIEAHSEYEHDYPIVNGNTGNVTFETRHYYEYSYCYIWGLKGKVKETSPELIALDDDDFTMNETKVQYELLPANYPVFNSYLDIYENDSRLYLSGAATDSETTIHQGIYFNWDKKYKAQLVVNKYYVEDIEIPFDIWDDDPEVSEQKELYFIKMNWVDLEGNKAEYATPLDPEELEHYEHDPGEPGGPGGFGGPPEDSTFSYLVDTFRFENVTIDMEASPQIMNLDLVSNVSDNAESFTLYRYGMGAFIDENETLSITMTDKPERDDTKLEELTSFTITPIFGEMKNLELYETGIDTNIFRSRRLEIVISLDQYPTDGIADTLEMTLTSNLAPGIIVTETLTETDLDSKIFTGPDNISLTFDHFSDRDSAAQDDIRSIVTCPALNLENAFIDARETAPSSLEFRTDVLHNQGEPGSGLFWKVFDWATRRFHFDNKDYPKAKNGLCDAEIFIEDSITNEIFILPDPKPKIKVEVVGSKIDISYLKDFSGTSDITFMMQKFDSSEDPVKPRIEYGNNEKTEIVLRVNSINDRGFVKADCDLLHFVRELNILNPDIDVDSDNNFTIEDSDDPIENEKPGCFVIINDNDSGAPHGDDNLNAIIDTDSDKRDLEKLKIRKISNAVSGIGSVTLEVSDNEKIRIFNDEDEECIGPSSTIDEGSYEIPIDEITEADREYIIEGITDGQVTISLSIKNTDNIEMSRDELIITVPKSFAIAGHGANYGIDDEAEDTRAINTGYEWTSVSTGDQLLQALKTFCLDKDTYIGKLYIFSHGYWRGIILEDDMGFYCQYFGLDESATLQDLLSMIEINEIRFAKNKSVIKLQACNTGNNSPLLGSPGFAEIFSQISDGIVYGATGDCGGVDYYMFGWFFSNKSPWRKWSNGIEITNPYVDDPDLTEPGRYQTNYLRFW